jgi:ABC-type glycerol-3-phosphate transport system substrate-binding protein
MRWILLGAALAVAAACGNGDSSQLDAGNDASTADVAQTFANVVLDPPDLTLTVPLGGAPATQPYKAYADTNGQTHVDVTSLCSFKVNDTTLGTFDGFARR